MLKWPTEICIGEISFFMHAELVTHSCISKWMCDNFLNDGRTRLNGNNLCAVIGISFGGRLGLVRQTICEACKLISFLHIRFPERVVRGTPSV